jgi:hypothetical protein
MTSTILGTPIDQLCLAPHIERALDLIIRHMLDLQDRLATCEDVWCQCPSHRVTLPPRPGDS